MAALNTCDSLWDLLSAYADGLASSAESTAVELHVSECSSCARDLDFMRETARVLAMTPEVSPPPGLQQAILAATIYLPDWKQRLAGAIGSLLPQPSIRGLAAAGSLGILLLVGYVAYTRQPTLSPPAPSRSDTLQPRKPEMVAAITPTTSQPPRNVTKTAPARSRDDSAELDLDSRWDSIVANSAGNPVRPAAAHFPLTPASFRRGGAPKTRLAPAPPFRRPAQSAHSNVADAIAPSLQPERPAEPDGMEITTADMKTPMPMNVVARSDMDPMGPTKAGGKDAESGTAAPSPKPHFSLAVQTDTSPSGAIVSLAELRRQLRKQNESQLVIHPELHLHGRRDLLDVMKSSF